MAFLGFSPKPLKLDLAGAAAGVASAADSPSSSVVGWGWVWGWWVRGCLSRLGVFRERCDSIGLDDRWKEGSGGWIDPLSMIEAGAPSAPPYRGQLSTVHHHPVCMPFFQSMRMSETDGPAQTRVVSCRRCCCCRTEAAGMKAATAAASASSSRI